MEWFDSSSFARRHIGPRPEEIREMLSALNLSSLEELIEKAVPRSIRLQGELNLPKGEEEAQVLAEARRLASENRVYRSYIGMGYSDCFTPPVIQRNILENPGWYTQYTPYQAEISQGRLEALLNFQTLVSDLTGLPLANASLLDEGTAAAEAMGMCFSLAGEEKRRDFFVFSDCHPQTLEVVRTRARPLGIRVRVGALDEIPWEEGLFGILLQYPASTGEIPDYRPLCSQAREWGVRVVVAADLLSLTLLSPPGEWGADVAVGNTQRFGVPLGFGGPHAAYFATREEFKRLIPGRLVGVSRDSRGKPALRLALQTREQHIRREKATSNICTAQVLLAIMASMYAVYHGPQGLRRIAERIHRTAVTLARGLEKLGFSVQTRHFFDTLTVETAEVEPILQRADQVGINFRVQDRHHLGVSLDETTRLEDVADILKVFSGSETLPFSLQDLFTQAQPRLEPSLLRSSSYLTHPVFNRYHSETEILRYLYRLQSKDLSLVNSMIPLGSCTMKLNATAELLPLSWPEFSRIHPFVPLGQASGYLKLFTELEQMLKEITGLAAVSLQPNAGSQGEYAGLLVIRAYHESRGEKHRDICLIPESAHGTNPASAVLAGLKVISVRCDENGNVDLDDLRVQARRYQERLAALMITYPSTHGVFEESIVEICEIVHQCGGQIYMDGANLNAQVGICRPGDYGVDICHLNLHKTFCIPHGGGGPGAGPIAVAAHLASFLPGHFHGSPGGKQGIGPVSSAPWGSPLILPISWAYIRLMGREGLKEATQVAILNANYIARRLDPHYPVLYKGRSGLVAHECILDLRHFRKSVGIEVADIAKRLMDYGFHAPTISWPVVETMMVEPTESESKAELDRFCEAMISIREEIREVETGMADPRNNVLKNAPHTAEMVTADEWPHPYTREKAAFPAPWVRERKFWPPVARIDHAFGDRNLFCVCPPLHHLAEVES